MPICEVSPKNTFSVITPGPQLEKFSNLLSCSNIEPVFIMQCSFIFASLLIIHPGITSEPSPIFTLAAIMDLFEINFAHLI